MSIIQTLLVFAGIPLLVILLVTAAVYGRSALHQPNRYRPGRPWNYPSAWYLPHPAALETVGDSADSDRAALEGKTSGAVPAGGASGEW